MSTYVWTFSATGLLATVTINQSEKQLVIRADQGSLDVNALWFSDGDNTKEGGTNLKNASLNMNGSASAGIIWDSVAELSAPGLGKNKNLKNTYLEKGEEIVYTLGVEPLNLGYVNDFSSLIIGLRATSVNGNGSVKLVDKTPEQIIKNKLPIAADDSNTITEDGLSVSGNVLSNDTLGDGTEAENRASLDGQEKGNYGTISLNQDGTYTYKLDNENPLVQKLSSDIRFWSSGDTKTGPPDGLLMGA